LPIAGSVASVRRVGATELREHHWRVLHEYPLVVVAVGDLEHRPVVDRVRDLLSLKASTRPDVVLPRTGSGRGAGIRRKDVTQTNVVLGTSIPIREQGHQRLALGLMNVIFGDGMASRLFQKVREEYGLAYSIYSAVDNYRGCRSFDIALGMEPKRQQKALDLIRVEVRNLLQQGLQSGELERAKSTMLGGIMLGMDGPSHRMNRLARQVIRSGHFSSFPKLRKELTSVSDREVMDVVEEVFALASWSAGAVIPRRGSEIDLEPVLHFSKA
ncbi:MAG TPA: insulinase family protein, partial [Fibrobacteraceae bacterium]|nr:insulinase family protein [Fibrobacteraceae bacterium]